MSAPNLPSELDAATEPTDVIVRRLVRVIDYAEGFWLGFVRCNLIDQRCKAAAACRDLLAPLGIRMVEIDLTEPVSELLPLLKARIAEEQNAMNPASELPSALSAAVDAARPVKLALFVSGLEHSIPSSEAYPPILSHLNLNRELFRQEILYPLVIWLPEYALTALARRAPDFWAWRSGLYELAPEAELAAHTFAPIRDEAWYVSVSLSEQAKRERLAMLKGLLADYRELGNGPHERRTQSEILNELGLMQRALGELSEARQAYQDSLVIARYDNNPGMIAALVHNLAMLAQNQGDYEEARRLYGESLEIKQRLGNQSGIASTLHELGRLAQRQGDYEEARRLYNESLAMKRKLGNIGGEAISLFGLALLNEEEGKYGEAIEYAKQAQEIFERLRSPNTEPINELLQRLQQKISAGS